MKLQQGEVCIRIQTNRQIEPVDMNLSASPSVSHTQTINSDTQSKYIHLTMPLVFCLYNYLKHFPIFFSAKTCRSFIKSFALFFISF